MKTITVSDMTLTRHGTLSFKERIAVARNLDRLHVDVIHMPTIENERTDALLIRTVSAFVENSVVAVEAGLTEESVKNAAAAVSSALRGRLVVRLSVSPVQMEYMYHKKAPKLLDMAKALFSAAVATGKEVEFFAADATRAESGFLSDIIAAAAEAGVSIVTLCDDEGILLPDEFSAFVSDVKERNPALSNMRLAILCKDTNGMATASATMAIRAGADEIKCCVGVNDIPSLETLSGILEQCGDRMGITSGVRTHELHRITRQIAWLCGATDEKAQKPEDLPLNDDSSRVYDANDTKETLAAAVLSLGYELSSEDLSAVYQDFLHLAQKKKTVGLKDIDAIVANAAGQVPPTYRLVSYVINNGNIITSSAQITLEKNGESLSGIAMGDGPVDASFRTLEQIIGHHFELDDFRIQAVTEGREAVGNALVRLRSDGKLYAGNGISTDVIGASIRAYISAVNKIVYEENNK